MPNKHLDRDNPLHGKKSGKWTKHGGAIYGMVKERIDDVWCCQSCGAETPKELPPFLYEIYPGEYIRICNTCKSTASKLSGQDSYQIINRVRHILKMVKS